MMTLRQYFRLILCLIGFIARGKQVSLSLKTNTVLLGGDIVLTCIVDGVKEIDMNTTRQWSMGEDDELLCYNGRINNIKKYKEKVPQTNTFSLTIFNVTESDLNLVYQCRYGFDAASKLIEADESQTFLSLSLVTDFIVFGGCITLTCAVKGNSALDRDVTRQWSMGSDDQLISYNGRINNRRKYEETVLSVNEFSLEILNVTEADVNVPYRCRYGFVSANTFIDLNEYNYVYPPRPESTTILYFLGKEMDSINISIYFKRVFPLPNCSVNIKATKFDITDLREHEVDMDVNLSLSLQRRVACSRSFNISCHLARNQYDVGYLKLRDECSFKDKFDSIIIISVALITLGLLIMIIGLVKLKRLVSKENNTNEKEKNQTNQDEDKTESERLIILHQEKRSKRFQLY